MWAHSLHPVLCTIILQYPDENDYDAFLTKHGGSSNAYTELVGTAGCTAQLATHATAGGHQVPAAAGGCCTRQLYLVGLAGPGPRCPPPCRRQH
jgi:hypothetical protein